MSQLVSGPFKWSFLRRQYNIEKKKLAEMHTSGAVSPVASTVSVSLMLAHICTIISPTTLPRQTYQAVPISQSSQADPGTCIAVS